MKKYAAIIISVFYLAGCVYYPKVNKMQKAKCELVTKKLKIDKTTLDPAISSPSDLFGFLIVGGLIAATTIAVSGSIMIAGNTIHWIEQEGTCDGGIIKNAIGNLSDSLQSVGGWFASSKDKFLGWINTVREETKLNEPDKS